MPWWALGHRLEGLRGPRVRLFPFDVADLDRDPAGGGGAVGGEDHLVGAEGVLETGEGNLPSRRLPSLPTRWVWK